jgi:hypothetical protein
MFHEHYFVFNVNVASPINCDVGVGEGGVRSSGDGVGSKTNHSRLLTKNLVRMKRSFCKLKHMGRENNYSSN